MAKFRPDEIMTFEEVMIIFSVYRYFIDRRLRVLNSLILIKDKGYRGIK